MPDLDFGETDEDAILVLKGFADRVNSDLYNHGTKGLLTTFNMFVTAHATQEAMRERQQRERHQENAERLQDIANKMGHKSLSWTIAGVAVALAGCAIAALAIIVMIRLANHVGKLDPEQLFHSQSLEPVLSYSQHSQDAQIPLNP